MKLRDPAVIVPRVPVSDFQIPLCYQHLWIELQGPGKGANRLVDQPFLVVEHTEIVVRAWIDRVDTIGE